VAFIERQTEARGQTVLLQQQAQVAASVNIGLYYGANCRIGAIGGPASPF
jgi:hypothetical protein